MWVCIFYIALHLAHCTLHTIGRVYVTPSSKNGYREDYALESPRDPVIGIMETTANRQ